MIKLTLMCMLTWMNLCIQLICKTYDNHINPNCQSNCCNNNFQNTICMCDVATHFLKNKQVEFLFFLSKSFKFGINLTHFGKTFQSTWRLCINWFLLSLAYIFEMMIKCKSISNFFIVGTLKEEQKCICLMSNPV